MEWHKVKNIILALLILVNAILLGSRMYMNHSERTQQQQAAAGAVAYLESLGILLDESLIPLEPLHRDLCVIPRDRSSEESFARWLLEDSSLQSLGGTDRYENDTGSIVWRNGGQLEISLTSLPALQTLGEKLDGSVLQQDSLQQTIDSLPVFNCVLSVSAFGQLQGRWCFGEPALLEEGTEMSVAGLLVCYGRLVASAPPERITALEQGYLVESVPNLGVRLIPVLRITADGVSTCLNALNGEYLIAE